MQILYVEDECDISELTCLVLGDMGGHSVHAFRSGPTAINALASLPPVDLLLLDVMMPVIDGPTLLSILQTRPETAHCPAIFMTAKTMQSEKAALLDLGAIGVIPKPFDPMTLCENIEALLAAQQEKSWKLTKEA